jgi:hypothetical protein
MGNEFIITPFYIFFKTEGIFSPFQSTFRAKNGEMYKKAAENLCTILIVLD